MNCEKCWMSAHCANCNKIICTQCGSWYDNTLYCKGKCYKKITEINEIESIPVKKDCKHVNVMTHDAEAPLVACMNCGEVLETDKEKIKSIKFPLHYQWCYTNKVWDILDSDNWKILEPNVGGDDECKVAFLVDRLNLADNLVNLFQTQELK